MPIRKHLTETLMKSGEFQDILVDNLLVHVNRTDEGVVVDVFDKRNPSEPVATTYAYFHEDTTPVDDGVGGGGW